MRNRYGNLALASIPDAEIDPRLQIPEDTASITFYRNGRVTDARRSDSSQPTLGKLLLVTFEHPQNLVKNIDGLFVANSDCSKVTAGEPGSSGVGAINQGVLAFGDNACDLLSLPKTFRIRN